MKSMVAIILVFLTAPAIAMAAPARPGGYASGFVGATVPVTTDVQSFDFVNSGIFNDRVEFDPGIDIGGTIGYDFGMARVEGEISYKRSEIRSITDKTDGFRFLNVDGNVDAFAMMFNAFLDIHNNSPVTPYLGGGIGFASLRLSDTFGADTRGGPVQQTLLYVGDTDTVFAYQVGAGAAFALNRYYSIDVGYRYFGTDRGRFGDNVNSSTNLRFDSHNAVVGFRVRF